MNIGHEILYLSRADIEAINLPMSELMDILEQAYIEKNNGNLDMPPKLGIAPAPEAFIHAMPCWLPEMHAAGLKWVGGTRQNKSKGLPFWADSASLTIQRPVCLYASWIAAGLLQNVPVQNPESAPDTSHAGKVGLWAFWAAGNRATQIWKP